MSENRVAVIKNPGAGGVADDTGESLDRAFREAQVNYKLFESEDPASAATTALEEGYLHLCACGGDGTVSGVVNAILRSNAENARLSIIPLGTGNVIAAALEVPSDVAEAVALVSTGSTRLVDAGKVGSDSFVLGIGIGATERFVTQAGAEAKEKLGRLAYVISLFRHASAATHMADIQVDGKKQASMRADAITLASMWGTRGRKMLEDSLADDGVMELVVNKRFSKWALFRLAWRGLRGDLASDEDVAVFSGARFTISTTPSLPIQLDGNESQLVTPIEVEVLPRALCVSVSVT